MRAKIKKVIGGKVYNTESAEVIASNEYWDGNNYERSGRNIHLYKTQNGNYFAGYSTQWQGETDYIEPLSRNDAKKMYEELHVQEVEYAEAFGEEPQEA